MSGSFALDKAAADAHIQLAVQYRLNDLHQISGVVLAVTVHLYSNIITIGAGITITALHAAANAKVDRQIQKRIAMLRQQFSERSVEQSLMIKKSTCGQVARRRSTVLTMLASSL